MATINKEEKAKRYDEAIKVAKGNYETIMQMDNDCTFSKEGIVNTFLRMFPELKESEGERIRKRIIALVNAHGQGMYKNEMLGWLEKQGKNNMGISEATKKKLEDNLNQALGKETPESWNDFLDEQDYQPVNTDYISGIRVGLLSIEGNAKNINGLTESQWVAIRAANRLLAEYIEKVQQKPWSEEDEKIINKLIAVVELYYGIGNDLDKQRCLSWLNSLKDRYTWKPSELPHWKKSFLPDDNTTGFNSDYFCYKGYNINYKELFEKLPKDN